MLFFLLDINLMSGSSRRQYLSELLQNKLQKEDINIVFNNPLHKVTVSYNETTIFFDIVFNCRALKESTIENSPSNIQISSEAKYLREYLCSLFKFYGERIKMLDTTENTHMIKNRLEEAINEIKKKLTECNEKILEQNYENGETLLHYIMQLTLNSNISKEVIPILVNRGLNLSAIDSGGNTPLLWGLANANFESVMTLLDHTPPSHESLYKINQLFYKTSPLDLVTIKGYRNIDAQETPIAKGASCVDIAQKLVAMRVPVSKTEYYEYSPLAMAVLKGDVELFNIYIQAFLENEREHTKKFYLKKLSKEIHDALRLDYISVTDYLNTKIGGLYFLESEEVVNENKTNMAIILLKQEWLSHITDIYEVVEEK